MNINEAIQLTESHEVAAIANLASGVGTLLTTIQRLPSTKTLLEDPNVFANSNLILARVIEITRQETDPRYASPWDISLTTYLWVLMVINPALAKVAADLVVQTPRTWWADRLARFVLSRAQLQTTAAASYRTEEVEKIDTRTEASQSILLASATLFRNLGSRATAYRSKVFVQSDSDESVRQTMGSRGAFNTRTEQDSNTQLMAA